MNENTHPQKETPDLLHAGIDEMNLAELPIASLGRNKNSKRQVLQCEMAVNIDGSYRIAYWTVSGAASEGLPTEFAERVLVILLAITHEQGYEHPDRKITFSLYEIIKRLGLSHGSYNYDRVKVAMRQLVGVTIFSDLAFRDAITGDRLSSTKGFGIIDNYDIFEKNGKEVETHIIWNHLFWRNFQAEGGVKYLDLDFYLSLKKAIARRLYRILTKRFYVAKTNHVYHEEDIYQLASRVGLSTNYPKPTTIRKKLRPGVQELIERGFLLSEEPVKYHTNGNTYTRIRFTKHPDYLTNYELAKRQAQEPADTDAPGNDTAIDPKDRYEAEAANQLEKYAAYGTTQAEIDLWMSVQDTLRGSMARATYESVLAGSMLLSMQQGRATVGLHTSQAVEWAESRLYPVIQQSLQSHVYDTEVRLAFVPLE